MAVHFLFLYDDIRWEMTPTAGFFLINEQTGKRKKAKQRERNKEKEAERKKKNAERNLKMSILEVNNIQKIYTTRFGGNKVQALSNVSFSVEKGEYVAIMGESGSGGCVKIRLS